MWDTISGWLLEHGVPILVILVASFIAFWVIKTALRRVVAQYVRVRGKGRHAKLWFENRTKTLSAIISSTLGVLLFVVALFMILSEVGVDIGPLLAGAGVLGIAVGFGAQSLIKDLLGGLFILLEDQFNKGDVVKIAGIAGLVEEVNLRRTVLRDLDGIVHVIPNGVISTASNYTRDWARVNLNISVGYSEDLDHVMAVINKVGKKLAEDDYYGKLIKARPGRSG